MNSVHPYSFCVAEEQIWASAVKIRMKFSFSRGLIRSIPWEADLNSKETDEIPFSSQKTSLKHKKINLNMNKKVW